MNGRNAFNPDTDDRPAHPVVKAEFGEDPARYLALDDLYLAFARIRGIDNLALLKEWQRIEAEHWGRSRVMKRLNARERELTNKPIDPTPDPTDSRATATDGGTVETPDDSGKPSNDLSTTADSGRDTSTPESASDSPDDLHPDTEGLVAGEVLILEYTDRTEYVFPATPAAEDPFLMRAFNGDDERTDDPIGLTLDELRTRADEHDPKPIAEIDIDAPRGAATNGGAE